MKFEIKTPSRLHFGLIDLQGISGRQFGGFGVGIKHPCTRLRFSSSGSLRIAPRHPLAGKVAQTWSILHQKFSLKKSGAVEIVEAPTAHYGFGSGTQVMLAAAVGFLRLNGLSLPVEDLAWELGRGSRSVIGITVFRQGGLVIDGGISTRSLYDTMEGGTPPLPLCLARYPFPKEWRLIIVIPKQFKGLSGEREREAFRKLKSPNLQHVQKISFALLLQILPALLEKDIAGFGNALTRVQQIVGEQFQPTQYSQFGNPVSEKLVRQLIQWGTAGAGQSSWGPAVYGLVEGDREAKRIQARLEEKYGGDSLTVFISEADNRGHRIVE
jgi:beta-RFAP synthase